MEQTPNESEAIMAALTVLSERFVIWRHLPILGWIEGKVHRISLTRPHADAGFQWAMKVR